MKEKHNLQPAWQNVDLGSIDPNLYLDERDAPELTVLWESAEATLSAAKAKTKAHTLKSLQRDDKKYREEVFGWVMRATGHSELAACVSDDLGLIQEAYCHAVTDDPYINALVDAYGAGRLPMREDFV